MPRRASSRSNPATTIGIIAVLVLILGGGFLLLNGGKGGYSDPPLPLDAFMSSANSLRGNTYSVSGRVNSIRPRNNGKFIHLKVTNGAREEHLPLIVPNDLDDINIEREQQYRFRVEILQGGIPKALELSRL
jgi:hypothetical protein